MTTEYRIESVGQQFTVIDSDGIAINAHMKLAAKRRAEFCEVFQRSRHVHRI